MLPVSGLTVIVREPTGVDEVSVVESALRGLPAMLDLARRVVTLTDGGPVDWDALPATDLVAVSLMIRRAWIGELITTEGNCPGAGCGERFDISFPVSSYLADHRPRHPRGVSQHSAAGWYLLPRSEVRFRIPTVADALAAAVARDPAGELASRCVDPPGGDAALARRIDRALSALAPGLDGLVGGSCPACGTALTLTFDPLLYTLSELRDTFRSVYDQTHALAVAYGWTEHAVLAMPRSRRGRYASLIARDHAQT